MPYSVIYSSCGCWVPIKYDLASTYVAYDSTDEDYKPYVNPDGKYYVPSNMAEEQIKFIEVSEAPALNAMSYFIGVQDNGDDTGTDYRFTPEQLVEYVQSQTRKEITASADGVGIADPFIDDSLILVVTLGQSYTSDMFTVAGDTLTPPGGVLTGQKLILYK